MSDKKSGFVCRVCGHNSFREIMSDDCLDGSDDNDFRLYCVCAGCSVIFIDPDKFSA